MEKYTFSDSTTAIRSVVPEFDLLSPKEVPFLKYISGGSLEEPSLNSLSEPCRAMKYEWLEDSDPPVQTKLLAGISAGATALTVTADDAKYITDDMVLQIDSEQFRVTSSDGANTIVVTPAWGNTAQADHAADAVVFIVGRVHREGAEAPGDSYTYPTMPYNYAQEMAATILLSELEQAIARYGIDDAVEYDTAKKSRQLFILLERQCFYGKRVQGVSTSVPSAMGGLDTFITASGHVKDMSGGNFVATDIEDLMQKCYEDVGLAGVPDVIVCNAWQRRKISEAYSSVGVQVYRDQQVRRGGVIVDVVDTHFGPLDILLTNWCPTDTIYLLKKDKIGIGPVEGKAFMRQPLAKTGTSDKWMISGSYVLQVRANKSHAILKGCATS